MKGIVWSHCWTLASLCISLLTSTGVAQGQAPASDIVKWDKYSISVHGERLLLLSGEFHPFRLPSPGLWLDVFQKVRALGYSCVSFYVDWALLEGEPGEVRVDGVFALEKFFATASEAGIYLIARPGPYINAEVSGGGFPGWLSRLKGRVRSSDKEYFDAITPYISTIGSVIAKAQVTNGGPVILLQPENEYTLCEESLDTSCLDKAYMAYIEKEYRNAGIEVPFIVNDAVPLGNFAPGTGLGAADIYGFDFYPLGWEAGRSDPSNWSSLRNPLQSYDAAARDKINPGGLLAILEFQGGVPDAWGGVGVQTQAALINHEFARVFYKLNYGLRIAIQNLYMVFGGTNWGNLGHPGGYTSYDVGAAIDENRGISREKYSELKLQANLLSASPEYLTMKPKPSTSGVYTDSNDLLVTPLSGSSTSFYIVHHRDLESQNSVSYKLKVKSTLGNFVIPQLGGSLMLSGRDSKVHLVDYDIGGIKLVYSSFEMLTWKRASSKTVLVLYGGPGETHEFAVKASLGAFTQVEGRDATHKKLGSLSVVQWKVDNRRRVVKFGSLEVHLLSRNQAYNYWVILLPAPQPKGLYASPSRANDAVIVKAGYLVRTAIIDGENLRLTGDINSTTEIELISAPKKISSLYFNEQKVNTKPTNGRLTGTVDFKAPAITLPNLQDSPSWSYIDSLPEISDENPYDDDLWTRCNLTGTNNPRKLSTPTSLYASDYGYHAGSLLYRGKFVAMGVESAIDLLIQGGYAFAYSVWLNSTYLGSWPGSPTQSFHKQTFKFPAKLDADSSHTLTILIDHMGMEQNFLVATQQMKDPRGILDYNLAGRNQSAIIWKLTGNFGGEHYFDHTRGPLNEGATFAERKGYHLPGALLTRFPKKSPFQELPANGVGYYATRFDLNIPAGYDIPLSFIFKKCMLDGGLAKFRVVLYVNGWQFGKYVNNIGPQTRFPVPEGILNYNGVNTVALIVWTQEDSPLKLCGLALETDAIVQSGYRKPSLVEGETWKIRSGSY
ncbi:glycoside hydrolase family 35 protein [Aspergillus affinis]|uniref:glycoside hydrolase family 35 protein n=1 Tax=Aspergillus affinis TaxID=1070780 RepID=UPI0022FE4D04|nr:beta-galactosidase [Aspergillus affinis]KAI9045940.1 beta-galactosidase [Aspergillus affinis]